MWRAFAVNQTKVQAEPHGIDFRLIAIRSVAHRKQIRIPMCFCIICNEYNNELRVPELADKGV